MGGALRSCCRSRHQTDAGNRRRHRRRRAGLSAPAIHDDRRGRHRGVRAARLAARLAGGAGLRDRSDSFGRRRFHRHERFGARQRAHGAGGDQVARRGSRDRLQVGRGDRDAGRRPRAHGRHRLLHVPHRRSRLPGIQPRGGGFAGGAGLRRFADLDLRAARRRHFHQGRRRRRRSRGQGRGRHPRGRSAQPGDHRRQRGRQCRRLRRHGRRPVRDLCGDRGRHHGAGRDLLRGLADAQFDADLSARHRRRLHHHLDHRHVLREAAGQQLDHGRALSRLHRVGGAFARWASVW